MLVHVVVGFAGCDAGDVLDFDEASAWGESRESRNGSRQKAGSTRPRSTIYEREFVRFITVVSFVHERTVHRPPREAVESRNFDLEAWKCRGCMVWKVVIRGPRVGWSCASEQFQSDGLCPAKGHLVLWIAWGEGFGAFGYGHGCGVANYCGSVWQIEDGVEMVSRKHCRLGADNESSGSGGI